MGNKRNKKKAMSALARRKLGKKSKDKILQKFAPKKLSALCNIVIKKYKLWPKPTKQFTAEPSSCTVVGGKPLRKRTKASVSSDTSTSAQRPKIKKRDIKAGILDHLIKRVGGEGKRQGRPRKELPGTSSVGGEFKQKGRPRKEAFPEISVTMAGMSSETEISIKLEPGTGANDRDPFAPDDDYTVIVKEEFEADEETNLVAQTTSTSVTAPGKVMMPTLVCSQNVGPSSSSLPSAISTMTSPPLMTVVADEMQIFANSIAEQLRKFPLDRALLLQLEIQTMIDNERQLLLH